MEKRTATATSRLKLFLTHLWDAKMVWVIGLVGLAISTAATTYFYFDGTLIAYGDAESHLNIAKRVVDSLTPGLAQLGGIWLPLPHLLMVPFVAIDTFWRTGIAGAIVSGTAYIVTSIFLYKFGLLLTKNKPMALLAAAIFMLNPNVLYMQSTAMTEVLLICFFTISNYYFFVYLTNLDNIFALIAAGVFGLSATLTRYDGWFLVLFQAGGILLYYLSVMRHKKERQRAEGQLLLFSTVAFFGIILWFLWGYLILDDPLYFTNSPFSAKSQQQGWLAKGELPAYQDIETAIRYYAVTASENIGRIITVTSVLGIVTYLFNKQKFKLRFLLLLLLLTPFIFYAVTLYIGQSVIFIPSLTPEHFEWQLFNVRYGIMMVPIAGIFSAYLFWYLLSRKNWFWNALSILIPIGLILQTSLFFSGEVNTITYQDATVGLSSAATTDAQHWLAQEYDHGLVLMDDYSRTLSVIHSGIPMENVIYIGTKPYWEESLEQPEKYARWVVMQQNDAVWKNLYSPQEKQDYLYKYFERTYTSPEILIFKLKDEFENRPEEVAEN